MTHFPLHPIDGNIQGKEFIAFRREKDMRGNHIARGQSKNSQTTLKC
jgi:hypothetical protein